MNHECQKKIYKRAIASHFKILHTERHRTSLSAVTVLSGYYDINHYEY